MVKTTAIATPRFDAEKLAARTGLFASLVFLVAATIKGFLLMKEPTYVGWIHDDITGANTYSYAVQHTPLMDVVDCVAWASFAVAVLGTIVRAVLFIRKIRPTSR
ncbi:MAG TPA: hypothetical protein VLA88_02675 [Candidatus Saccharimonadales bacterium]|nr:hypothetical protein [Candidatus Saccharimonadales bacterium]